MTSLQMCSASCYILAVKRVGPKTARLTQLQRRSTWSQASLESALSGACAPR